MKRKIPTRHKISRIALGTMIVIAFALVFAPFLVPILMASLFAFALNPYVERAARKRKSKTMPVAALLSFLFFGVSLPIAFVAWRVVSKIQEYSTVGFENTGFFIALRTAADHLHSVMLGLAMQAGMDTRFSIDPGTIFAKIGPSLVNGAAYVAAQFPSFLFMLLVFCAVLYFFIMESDSIRRFFDSLDLLEREDLDHIVSVIQRSSFTALVSASLVGAIQAFVVALMAVICGYEESLIIFLVTFVLSFIPVVGAAPVAALLAALSFIQGGYSVAITLIMTAAFVGSIDNVIKHYVLRSSEDKVHPIIDLLSIIGAVLFYGVPGLFLGPVLARLAIHVTPLLFGLRRSVDAD